MYLDESGNFVEERVPGGRSPDPFPSQIVGVLASKGAITEERAERALAEAFAVAGVALPEVVHCTELYGKNTAFRDGFSQIASRLIDELSALGWQPVRIRNEERVNFGGRIPTYTNVIAELLMRILHRRTVEGGRWLEITVNCEGVRIPTGPYGLKDRIEIEEYLTRIDELTKRAGIWKELAEQASYWKVRLGRIIDTKKCRELQVCDFLSYATLDGASRCKDKAVRKKVLAAFDSYDFTLAVIDFFSDLDKLIDDDSLGFAIQVVAERLVDGALPPGFEEPVRDRLGRIIGSLAGQFGATRDGQLRLLSAWLEKLIDVDRKLARGRKLVDWLLAEIERPLRAALAVPGEIDWFSYMLHRWALTACNHLGLLAAARRHAERLDPLVPSLVARSEHLDLLIEGLVAQGVHWTDCFEFERCSEATGAAASLLGEVNALVSQKLAKYSVPAIRSTARGKALGTWLQSEMYAALGDPGRFTWAREISDEAIAEWSTLGGVDRQYQYRCQLETLAGNFAEAREFLGKALAEALSRVPGDAGAAPRPLPAAGGWTHAELAGALAALGRPRFLLHHYLRLGAACCLAHDAVEEPAFRRAAEEYGIMPSLSEQLASRDFPEHGIWRQAVIVHATARRWGTARRALDRLHGLGAIQQRSWATALVELAAWATLAGLQLAEEPDRARALLVGSGPGGKCLQGLIEEVRSGIARLPLAALRARLEAWSRDVAAAALPGADLEGSRRNLVALGRSVGF
ncbi:MAG: hypothetical protein FJZ01_24565 [Candidatus Sericytochromatia bacterium]|nr:hypothetical protein [Candidatus Tanganyikabacteria bacterium]